MNTKPDARAAAWLAALGGVALTAWTFWPGLMSVDSAVQYSQALGLRRFDDVHPPLMTLMWRAADAAIAGPGGIWLAFVVAWWAGIAAVVAQYADSGVGRRVAVATVLAAGLFPATYLILGHVWKDVAMASALLLACAAILASHRHAARRWRWLALLALLVACCLRHNALFAVLPLLAWLCWPRANARVALDASEPGDAGRAHGAGNAGGASDAGLATDGIRVRDSRDRTPSRAARAVTFVVLAGALALAPTLLAYALRADRAQAWTAVALWDLAAISIEANDVLLPASLVTPDLTVDELRGAYVPYANPPLFGLGKILLSFYVPYSHAQTRDLQRAWLGAIVDHPGAYLRHRARLSRYLLFGFPQDVPRELVYVPERRVLAGTPIALPPVDESTPFWRAAAALRSTPLFAGATYLVLALIAALAVRRHRDRLHRATVLALVTSAWANALPLLLISGSAEFRYLAWTALAAVLASLLVLARHFASPVRAEPVEPPAQRRSGIE